MLLHRYVSYCKVKEKSLSNYKLFVSLWKFS